MVKKKAVKKTSKKSNSWWNQRLALKYFWPILAALFLLFLLTIFNLLFLWQIRLEINNNLQTVQASVKAPEPIEQALSASSDESLAFNESLLMREEVTAISSQAVASSSSELVSSEMDMFDSLSYDELISLVLGSKEYPAPVINKAIAQPSLELNEPEPSSPAIASPEIVMSENLSPIISEQVLSGRLSSISDSFSGLANIDKEATDMYWDDNITAFTFPPVYELSKQSDCSVADCGLSRAMVDVQSSCLEPGCLTKVSETELAFNGKTLQLPPVLQSKNILNINIFALKDSWLLGIVTGPKTAEQGWVYSFDGLSFSPLISDNSAYQIKARYQRGGGEITFGGDDADFLVLYSGYDAHAFRFRDRKIEDVSKYFGLRVSRGGFEAQIIKLDQGAASIYYVCSLSDNKAKLIKIWSKDALTSAGALDFSTVFRKSAFYPSSILCGVSDANQKKLLIAARINGAYELWRFEDKGFDNSRTRQVTSLNLASDTQTMVKAAVIADLGLEAQSSCPGPSAMAYVANEPGSFEAVTPYLWHSFSMLGNDVYWRFVFQPEENVFYSPWFDNVNRFSYLSPEE